MSKFKNKVFDKLRHLIEEHIANDPDVIKGRKKTVQVSGCLKPPNLSSGLCHQSETTTPKMEINRLTELYEAHTGGIGEKELRG